MGDDYLSTEHLLVGLATGNGPLAKALQQAGATSEALTDAVKQLRGGARVDNPNPEDTFQALEKFGTDMTALARTANSIRSLAAIRKSAAWCRCFRGAPRITRCSSVSLASVKPRWLKDSLSA